MIILHLHETVSQQPNCCKLENPQQLVGSTHALTRPCCLSMSHGLDSFVTGRRIPDWGVSNRRFKENNHATAMLNKTRQLYTAMYTTHPLIGWPWNMEWSQIESVYNTHEWWPRQLSVPSHLLSLPAPAIYLISARPFQLYCTYITLAWLLVDTDTQLWVSASSSTWVSSRRLLQTTHL